MKIEHKLSPAVAMYAAQAIESINTLRRDYLAALGTAKEIETRVELVRQALGQQLALVEQAEGLPRPVAPYQLSPDGKMLIGEIADNSPAEEPPAAAELPDARNGAKRV